MGLAQKISRHWAINPDGTGDGRWPDGDKDPTPASASWDNAALQAGFGSLVAALSTGTAVNHDVKQYASGAGVAGAALTLLTISGTNAATNGWGTSGANVTNAGSNAGAGAFRIGLSIAGNVVYSDPVSWAYAAPATDTLAPTVPSNLSGVSGVGEVELSWDASTDPPDGATPASGIDHYDVRLGASVVGTASPSGGFNQSSTSHQIGSGSSPAVDVTRDGADWDIEAEGFFDSTADRGTLEGWQISGDFSITGTIASIDSPVNNSRVGFSVRNTLDPGAIKIEAYYRHAATPTFRTTTRSALNAATANPVVTSGVSLPLEIKVERVGTAVSTYLNGELATTQTLPMASTVYLDLLNVSQSNGVSQTAHFTGVAVQVASRVSFTHTTALGGNYSVRAVDAADNASAYTATINVTPISTAALVKWHPGHYVGTLALNSLPAAQITEIAALPAEVVGIGLYYSWRFLEPARGNYNFAPLITALDQLDAAGLKALLYLADRTFAGTTRYAPDYLTSESGGNGGIWNKANGGTLPKIWETAIMNRAIAFWEAMGDAINGHPALEMVKWEELTPGLTAAELSAANFSWPVFLPQMYRWVTAVKAAFPNVNIAAPGNFSGDPSFMGPWIEHCYQNGVGIGGPDVFVQQPLTGTGGTLNKDPSWSDRIIRGERWNGSAWVSGGFDYRGKMLVCNDVQGPEMGKGYVWSPTAFYNYAPSISQGLGQNHMHWWRKDWVWPNRPANQQTYWSNATAQPDANWRIKSWLALGSHPMPSDPPDFYNGNVDTG